MFNLFPWVGKNVSIKYSCSSNWSVTVIIWYLNNPWVLVVVCSGVLYLFGQLLSHQLHFLPGGHRVSTPGCIEENERHLGHTPETLHLERKLLLLAYCTLNPCPRFGLRLTWDLEFNTTHTYVSTWHIKLQKPDHLGKYWNIWAVCTS